MVTGVQMEKESIIYNRIVYIAIPKPLFDDPMVFRAMRRIHSLKPLAIGDCREMFGSNAEWQRQFPNFLKTYDVCILISNTGIIGKGCCDEIRYFLQRNLPCYQYVESGEPLLLSIMEVKIVNENDWVNYAITIFAV